MAKSGYFFRVSPLDQHADKLNKIIQDLIKQNVFSRVVRDAIRLYASLSEGQTDVLEELFPFVRNHYCGDRDPDETRKIVEEAVLSAMRQQSRPMQQDASLPPPPAGYPLMKQAGQGVGTLANRAIAMPTFDDDEPDDGATIVLTKAANQNHQNNGGNLLSGIFGLD